MACLSALNAEERIVPGTKILFMAVTFMSLAPNLLPGPGDGRAGI